MAWPTKSIVCGRQWREGGQEAAGGGHVGEVSFAGLPSDASGGHADGHVQPQPPPTPKAHHKLCLPQHSCSPAGCGHPRRPAQGAAAGGSTHLHIQPKLRVQLVHGHAGQVPVAPRLRRAGGRWWGLQAELARVCETAQPSLRHPSPACAARHASQRLSPPACTARKKNSPAPPPLK